MTFKVGDRIRCRQYPWEAVVISSLGRHSCATGDQWVCYQFTYVGDQSFKVGDRCHDANDFWELMAPALDPFNQQVADYCQRELGRV